MGRPLAIFDFNGTILEDTRACVIAGNAEMEYLGMPPIDLKILRENFDFPIVHFFERLGISAATYLENVEILREIFYKTYNLNAANTKTRPGTRKFLDWLKDNDIDMIILSNEHHDNLEFHISRLKLGHYFKAVLGNDISSLATAK